MSTTLITLLRNAARNAVRRECDAHPVRLPSVAKSSTRKPLDSPSDEGLGPLPGRPQGIFYTVDPDVLAGFRHG